MVVDRGKKKKTVAPLSSSLLLAAPTHEATAECDMLTQHSEEKGFIKGNNNMLRCYPCSGQ